MDSIKKLYHQHLIDITFHQGRIFLFIGLIGYLLFVIVPKTWQICPPYFLIQSWGIVTTFLALITIHILYKYKQSWLLPIYTLHVVNILLHIVPIIYLLQTEPVLLNRGYSYQSAFIIFYLLAAISCVGTRRWTKYLIVCSSLLSCTYILSASLINIHSFLALNIFACFLFYYLHDSEQKAFSTFKSIEEIKISRAALTSSNKELDHANQKMQEINYALSHDLKSPLRNMMGFAQLLQRKMNKTEKDQTQLEYIEFIIEGTKQLETLIEEILQFSKISWKKKEDLTAIDLNQLLANIEQNYQVQILNGTLKLSINYPFPTIKGHYTRYYLLIQNIIDNGIKYNENSVKRISIHPTFKDNVFQIDINDNGIGIAPEYHQKIFDIFERLHGSAQYKGSGIGLASCKEVMNQLGGDILVHSETGQGSTFSLVFPNSLLVHSEETICKTNGLK